MGLLDLFRREREAPEEQRSAGMIFPQDFVAWYPSAFPFRNNGLVALQVAVVWRCLDLISSSIATLNWAVYKEKVPISEPPAWLFDPEPSLYRHQGDALSELVSSLLLDGNAYVYVTDRYADGFPRHWMVLDPALVTVEWPPLLDEYRYGTLAKTYSLDGERLRFDDILHIRQDARPGDPYGHSPLEGAASSIASRYAADLYSTDVHEQKGIPPSLLEHPLELTGDEAKDLQDAWVRSVRNGAPAVLSGGIKWEKVGRDPKDDFLIESKQDDAVTIATAFGVPAFMLNLPLSTGLTYSTVEGQLRFFYATTLMEKVSNIERALSTFLPHGQHLNFDSSTLLRADIVQRAQASKTFLEAGIFTIDEIRARENLPPLSGFSEEELATFMAEATAEGGTA